MNNGLNDIKKAFSIIPDALRRRFKISIVFSLTNGILDLFSLGLLIPVIIAFLSPNEINTGGWMTTIYTLVGTSDIDSFQYALLFSAIILFVFKNIVSSLLNHYQNNSLFTISTALSESIYQKYFEQTYLAFTQSNSALAGRKINTIPHDFTVYILGSYIHLISEVAIASSIIIAIAVYSPLLLLLILVTISPVFLIWSIFKKKKLNHIESEFRHDYNENSKQLQKGVDSFIDAKLHQNQAYFIEKFITRKRKMNESYAFLKTAQQLPPKLLEIILVISIAVIFSYSLFFGHAGSLIPTLSIFVAAFYRLYPSVTKILSAITSLSSYHYVVEELVHWVKNTTAKAKQKVKFERQIRFDGVSFNYPNQSPLLSNIRVTVNQGDCIAIVGESGIGKSTLVKLLMGFISPTNGSILIDGYHFKHIDKGHWFCQMAYLQQQPVIMDGSILENIAFGETKPDLEKVNYAIEQANLTEFIQNLNLGINTPLGENGLLISGGQIQRIALARALYKDSELFIFDEISNNLDRTNLKEIASSIQRLHAAGKTVILIDHNPYLRDIADKKWQLSAGQILESANENISA